MISLKPSEEKILLALASLKYLTVSQLIALDIMQNKRNLSRNVKSLRDRGLLETKNYGFTPGQGRVENIHFLSKKGKKLLEEDFGLEAKDIKIPLNKNLFSQDYFHRKSTIDFQIHLDLWAKNNEASVAFFDTYFDKIGNNRTKKNLRAKTKIDLQGDSYMIPDGVFLLELPDTSTELYLLEVYNGKDTGRTVKQLMKHVEAIELGSTNEKYEFMNAYRVLSVFEYPSMMQSVQERIAEDDYFAHMKEHLYFKSLEEINYTNILEEWQNYDQETKSII